MAEAYDGKIINEDGEYYVLLYNKEHQLINKIHRSSKADAARVLAEKLGLNSEE